MILIWKKKPYVTKTRGKQMSMISNVSIRCNKSSDLNDSPLLSSCLVLTSHKKIIRWARKVIILLLIYCLNFLSKINQLICYEIGIFLVIHNSTYALFPTENPFFKICNIVPSSRLPFSCSWLIPGMIFFGQSVIFPIFCCFIQDGFVLFSFSQLSSRLNFS